MVEAEIGNGMRKILAAMLLLSWGYVCMAQGVSIEWETDPVDGHRTGVVASNADNVLQSRGYVKGRTYHSPNGRKFRGGTTPKVAVREYPECELYDWFVDELMRAVADSTGKKVDIGFTNRGGVRIDMPSGEILYDDIMSMFPFHNNLCYVGLHGREVKALLDQMAASRFQILGGVKVVAENGRILSATLDGEPIDDDKVYGVATINFLLDGGDGYHVSRNAVEVIHCNGWLYDTMLAYVAGLTAAGKPVEFENRHWITILDKDDRK